MMPVNNDPKVEKKRWKKRRIFAVVVPWIICACCVAKVFVNTRGLQSIQESDWTHNTTVVLPKSRNKTSDHRRAVDTTGSQDTKKSIRATQAPQESTNEKEPTQASTSTVPKKEPVPVQEKPAEADIVPSKIQDRPVGTTGKTKITLAPKLQDTEEPLPEDEQPAEPDLPSKPKTVVDSHPREAAQVDAKPAEKNTLSKTEVATTSGPPCLYAAISSCLQGRGAIGTDKESTFAQQHAAMEQCVKEWLETPSSTENNTPKSQKSFKDFQTTGRGELKDRLDWALFRLNATEAAQQNLKDGACGPKAPKKLPTPSWGNSKDLPQVSQHAVTGGVYLPPWYAMEANQKPFDGGFVLPMGPVVQTTTKINIQKGIEINVWDSQANLGDCYNHYLVAMLSGRKVNPRERKRNPKKLHPLACVTGSIVGPECELVWGTGRVKPDGPKTKFTNPDAQVFAMRGPNTLNITVNGYDNPQHVAFGDPGLLVSLLLPLPEPKEEVDFCVIPHYVDHTVLAFKMLQANIDDKKFTEGYSVRILNIETCDLTGYMEHLSGCRKVLSSSLHGLIFALSYGIPGARLIFSDKLTGGHFKFEDFYKGIGHPELYIHEQIKDGQRIPFKKMQAILEKAPIPAVSAEDLWNVNPFHAENVGQSRAEHMKFVASHFKNLQKNYPHKAYKPVQVHGKPAMPDSQLQSAN